jgi:hypothetical protein
VDARPGPAWSQLDAAPEDLGETLFRLCVAFRWLQARALLAANRAAG